MFHEQCTERYILSLFIYQTVSRRVKNPSNDVEQGFTKNFKVHSIQLTDLSCPSCLLLAGPSQRCKFQTIFLETVPYEKAQLKLKLSRGFACTSNSEVLDTGGANPRFFPLSSVRGSPVMAYVLE